MFQEHFYNPASQSGFIEYRLKTVRVKLPPTQKRYRSRFVTKTTTVEPVILLSDEELKQKVRIVQGDSEIGAQLQCFFPTLKQEKVFHKLRFQNPSFDRWPPFSFIH